MDRVYALIITILLGVYFTVVQGIEYFDARFRIADRVCGRVFFVATGFNGLHVIIGTIFLRIMVARSFLGMFSEAHHFGFEAAA